VTVVLDADYERSSMVCALFHDVDDVRLLSCGGSFFDASVGPQGPDFGRLIAKAILSGFLKEYPEFSTGVCVRARTWQLHPLRNPSEGTYSAVWCNAQWDANQASRIRK